MFKKKIRVEIAQGGVKWLPINILDKETVREMLTVVLARDKLFILLFSIHF